MDLLQEKFMDSLSMAWEKNDQNITGKDIFKRANIWMNSWGWMHGCLMPMPSKKNSLWRRH